jgi:hypothetical protein
VGVNINSGGKYMKKTRRRYDLAFKISEVAEPGSSKPIAQIARKHSTIELFENAFAMTQEKSQEERIKPTLKMHRQGDEQMPSTANCSGKALS